MPIIKFVRALLDKKSMIIISLRFYGNRARGPYRDNMVTEQEGHIEIIIIIIKHYTTENPPNL